MRSSPAVACLAGLVAVGATVRLPAAVTVYPTGTTIYNPAKAWSGFTILDSPDQGAVIVDMNGTVVKQWKQFAGASGPIRILPGGYVMGGTVPRPPYQETVALAQFDWNGKEVWRFDRTEEVRLANGTTVWAARHHHDWHREGSPAGYYAPDAMPFVDRGRTMILAHKNVTVPAIRTGAWRTTTSSKSLGTARCCGNGWPVTTSMNWGSPRRPGTRFASR